MALNRKLKAQTLKPNIWAPGSTMLGPGLEISCALGLKARRLKDLGFRTGFSIRVGKRFR